MARLGAGGLGEATIDLPVRAAGPRWYEQAFSFARRKPLGAFSALVISALVALALLAPLIAPYSPNANSTIDSLRGPGLSHLFGTDQYGRDVLSRLLYGAQTSLYVGLGATLLGISARS